MSKQELEEMYIESLDREIDSKEKENLLDGLHAHPEWSRSLTQHKKVRELLVAPERESFGPYFVAKLVHKIQNTGVVIDRQIFGLFRKFQLAAIGVIVALLILNIIFAEQLSWRSVLGLEQNVQVQEEAAPFDFSQQLNNLK